MKSTVVILTTLPRECRLVYQIYVLAAYIPGTPNDVKSVLGCLPLPFINLLIGYPASYRDPVGALGHRLVCPLSARHCYQAISVEQNKIYEWDKQFKLTGHITSGVKGRLILKLQTTRSWESSPEIKQTCSFDPDICLSKLVGVQRRGVQGEGIDELVNRICKWSENNCVHVTKPEEEQEREG